MVHTLPEPSLDPYSIVCMNERGRRGYGYQGVSTRLCVVNSLWESLENMHSYDTKAGI